eukprot:243647-Chlamydomonas_euryale.AAC.2
MRPGNLGRRGVWASVAARPGEQLSQLRRSFRWVPPSYRHEGPEARDRGDRGQAPGLGAPGLRDFRAGGSRVRVSKDVQQAAGRRAPGFSVSNDQQQAPGCEGDRRRNGCGWRGSAPRARGVHTAAMLDRALMATLRPPPPPHQPFPQHVQLDGAFPPSPRAPWRPCAFTGAGRDSSRGGGAAAARHALPRGARA